jgi:hypothetical protein
MNIQHAKDLRQSMRASNVIMAYNGEVTDELMVSLADILRTRILAMGDDQKRARTIFSVFMEQVQNLIWHNISGERSAGMIVISENEGEITMICGNRVSPGKADELRKTLELIQASDKDTIRQMYREGMSRSNENEGPGAGLGLLQIARNSTHPISFGFEEVSPDQVDYFLAARI